jgi:hypothetical protein
MKKLAISLALVISLAVLAAGCGDDDEAGPTASPTAPAGGSLPVGLASVEPASGSSVTNDDIRAEDGGVCVGFSFQVGQGMGSDPVSAVSLTFNAEDVTSQLEWQVTADEPPSSGAGCYLPPEPLASGEQEATVRYTDSTGRGFIYTWRFQVSE